MASRAVDPSISRTPLATDAENLATVCVLCSHNCGLRVDVADGRIVAVRADESSPISKGYICNKGFSIPHYVRHAQRVEHPLKRRADGSFERIGWEQAIAEIAAKLSAIRAAHSPRAIGLIGIGGQGNHMDAPYGLTFLTALGSILIATSGDLAPLLTGRAVQGVGSKPKSTNCLGSRLPLSAITSASRLFQPAA